VDWQKTSTFCTIGAFVVAVVWGGAQFYIWYKHGEIGMNGLVGFAVLVFVLFISGLVHLKAAKTESIRKSIVAAPPVQYGAPVPPKTIMSAPTTLPDKRIIVGVVPEELRGFYQNVTSAQGDRLLQPYIGKWMKLSGTVADIRHSGPDGKNSSVSFRDIGSVSYILMFFDANWYDHISVLERGSSATVLGKILSADNMSVQLDHCELIGLSSL
jgi:hypothetical protein